MIECFEFSTLQAYQVLSMATTRSKFLTNLFKQKSFKRNFVIFVRKFTIHECWQCPQRQIHEVSAGLRFFWGFCEWKRNQIVKDQIWIYAQFPNFRAVKSRSLNCRQCVVVKDSVVAQINFEGFVVSFVLLTIVPFSLARNSQESHWFGFPQSLWKLQENN